MRVPSKEKKPVPWFRVVVVLWLLWLGAGQEKQRQETAALRFYLEQQAVQQQEAFEQEETPQP